jgi:hypothetical protein
MPLEEPLKKVAKRESSIGASKVAATESKPKRKRRKSKRTRKTRPTSIGLPFETLGPAVLEAVRGTKGKEFTRKDIEAALENKGVKFDSNRVSLVLSKGLRGVKKVGTRKRESGGAPSHVYKAGQRLGLKNKKK